MINLLQTEEFYKIKHYINNLILFEMKLNRISSVSFFNRALTIPVDVPPPSIHDDSDDSGVAVKPEVKPTFESAVREYPISDAMLPIVQKYYEELHFTWVQDGDKIIIAWV